MANVAPVAMISAQSAAAVFNGSVWEQIDNTDAVTSVNGYTGTVVLTASDVGAAPATSGTSILYGNGTGS